MTVGWYSILLLLSTALALLLVLLGLAVGPGRTRATRALIMHSLSLACWATAHFLEQALLPGLDSSLAPIGSAGWFIYLLRAAGMVGTPIAWYLLGTYVEARNTPQPRTLAALGVFAAIAFGLAASNSATGILTTAENGTAIVSVRLIPFLIPAVLMTAIGTLRLARARWRGGPRMHVAAVLLVLATLPPTIGGTLWVAQDYFGWNMPVDPAPLLFPLVTATLLTWVLRQGFAGAVPLAAARAFRSMADAALVVDGDLVVTQVNDAAARDLPMIVPESRLADVLPALAEQAGACLAGDRGHGASELRVDDALYEVRVLETGRAEGPGAGCVILLSDVTELRRTQEQLERAATAAQADATTLRPRF